MPKAKANPPILFDVTFSLAISSCFAIWFSKCRSRFCSMSSCCRRSSMALLGASFLFCADCPPNQAPHILSVFVVSATLCLFPRVYVFNPECLRSAICPQKLQYKSWSRGLSEMVAATGLRRRLICQAAAGGKYFYVRFLGAWRASIWRFVLSVIGSCLV